LSGSGPSERVTAARVSPSVFALLGAVPSLGRTLTNDDDEANAPVAVLSFGLWNRAFGRDPSVVGRTIALDRRPYTIIGVMAESFAFPPRGSTLNGEPAALFVPIAFSQFERRAFGMMYNNSIVGRLKPSVPLDAARAEVDRLKKAVTDAYPSQIRSFSAQVLFPFSSFAEEVVGKSRRLLLLMMGAVGMVLLIGCVDVANLMLTRAAARQRELAIRSAIGASRARVVRQLLTESLVLSLCGGGLGLLLAYGAMRGFLSLAGTTLPRVESIGFDPSVIGFTIILSVATPLLFGLMPALQTATRSVMASLKEGSQSTPGRSRHRWLGSLVVAQFALALMLSVGAGLLVRSFVRLLGTNPGFRTEQAVTAAMTLPRGRYPTGQAVKAFYARAIEAARQIPGVSFVGAAPDRPLGMRERRSFTPDSSGKLPSSLSRVIAAEFTVGHYFQALGIPLKRGRFFTDADGQNGQPVVILNERLANAVWPNEDPIGHQIKWGIEASISPWMTVVGIVGDIKQGPLGDAILPQVYAPLTVDLPDAARGPVVDFLSQVNLIVRTDGDRDATMPAVAAIFRRFDPELPPAKTEAITDILSESVQPQRFSMTVVTLFAFVALALAIVGIYGVLANVVSQQTREIGVRVALGAAGGDLIWLVLRRALVLMALGLAIGTAGALGITRIMTGLLYEIRSTDAVAFGGSVALLASLAVAASLIPAWRATRVDPLVALRAD
jgi:predicted permease